MKENVWERCTDSGNFHGALAEEINNLRSSRWEREDQNEGGEQYAHDFLNEDNRTVIKKCAKFVPDLYCS